MKKSEFLVMAGKFGYTVLGYCPNGFVKHTEEPEIIHVAVRNFEKPTPTPQIFQDGTPPLRKFKRAPKTSAGTLVYGAFDPQTGAWFMGTASIDMKSKGFVDELYRRLGVE